MKNKWAITAIVFLLIAVMIGCATKTTTTTTPPAPKLSPAKVAALEGIACNLGKALVPNLSAADGTRVTNGCTALQTATTNWANGGTLADVTQAANALLAIWQGINVGDPATQQKVSEVAAAVEAILVIVSP